MQNQSEVVVRFSSLTSEEAKSVLQSHVRLKVWNRMDRICRISFIALPCRIVLRSIDVFHLVLTSLSPNECIIHTFKTQGHMQASALVFAKVFWALSLHSVKAGAEFGP